MLKMGYTPKPREWITSGPFQIDRSEYVLGEKIFLRIGGLNHNEEGEVIFHRPAESVDGFCVYKSSIQWVRKTCVQLLC